MGRTDGHVTTKRDSGSLRNRQLDFITGRAEPEFPVGRSEIIAFLTRKWAKELDYRLIKELWAFTDNRIAARFAYEWHDDSGQWFRSYGNENWEFDAEGINQTPVRLHYP
jgi:nuclear transport factor 2 (NTF2) superfamily protein